MKIIKIKNIEHQLLIILNLLKMISLKSINSQIIIIFRKGINFSFHDRKLKKYKRDQKDVAK